MLDAEGEGMYKIAWSVQLALMLIVLLDNSAMKSNLAKRVVALRSPVPLTVQARGEAHRTVMPTLSRSNVRARQAIQAHRIPPHQLMPHTHSPPLRSIKSCLLNRSYHGRFFRISLMTTSHSSTPSFRCPMNPPFGRLWKGERTSPILHSWRCLRQ